MSQHVFGFVGAGRMATALAQGIVEANLAAAAGILASDPSADIRRSFGEALPGATTTSDNLEVVRQANVVILAVKPQVMDQVLSELAPAIDARPLVMSVAAGVPISRIERALPSGARVVRVMPNTPALVRRGASAFSLGSRATPADAQLVAQLLSAVGLALELPEQSLDAVTGLSGSGPAFVYTMIEGLAAAGVAQGLAPDDALRLATQTVAGGAAMVLETGKSPAELRQAVTSPGGTTLAGLAALEQGGFTETIAAAVAAATRRSRELGSPGG